MNPGGMLAVKIIEIDRQHRALPLLKRISRAYNGNPEDREEFEWTFQKQPESYSARSGPLMVIFCLS
jgi:hypothetical protein